VTINDGTVQRRVWHHRHYAVMGRTPAKTDNVYRYGLPRTDLKVTLDGVALLEQDIAGRRPAYREYIARTNAFFPGARHS